LMPPGQHSAPDAANVGPTDARQPQVAGRGPQDQRCASGLRVHLRVAGSKANIEDGARNLIGNRRRAPPGKEKSMYIGIGTVVLIIIIVLVVLMLRRR